MTPRGTVLPAAVLWDMDGTLVDTEPYWFASERDLVEQYGGEWPDHHAAAVVGFDLLDSAEYIREHSPVTLPPHEIVDRLLDGVVARLHRRIPWQPGARELLEELRAAGVPCALVTMSWRRFVDPIVSALPADTFAAVITGDEVPDGEGKPHPTPYLMGAEACGVAPRDCIVIEDSPTGVRSALAAGCAVVGIPNVKSLTPHAGLRVLDTLAGVTAADLVPLTSHPEAGRDDHRPRRQRRELSIRRGPAMLAGLVAVTATVIGVAAARGGGAPEVVLPPGAVPIDAWAPYWTLADTVPETGLRLGDVREASPFWFGARGVGEIVVDENAPTELTDDFVERVRDSGARLVPSIRDETAAGEMAAILAAPTTRSRHVAAIRDFAASLDADGIDLDYEQFAFADGPATWETTRPNWVAFVEELAAALHADGRTLTISIPPVYDESVTGERGYWVYDHGAIAAFADAIRIMAYDYSVAEPGPIAPIGWVQDAVDGTSLAVPEEHHDKLVLGIPAYGSNWIVATEGVCPPTAEGRTSVTARSADELAAKRAGAPTYDPVTAEWSFSYSLTVSDDATSCVQDRVVRWVDAEGAAARIAIARRAGWGGVSLWALGYEDDAVWQAVVSASRDPIAATPTSDPTSVTEADG